MRFGSRYRAAGHFIALAICFALPGAAAALAPPVRGLSLPEAVAIALARNPELVALRRQHDVDAAGLSVARRYPFNPSYEGKIEHARAAPGEVLARDRNEEHKLLMPVEVRGQQRHRQAIARAVLSRTDAEIAAAEQALVARVVRLHAAVVYRTRKLAVTDTFVSLNEQAESESARLAEAGLLRGADSVLVATETADAKASRMTAGIELSAARNELNAALGTAGDQRPAEGTLETPPLAFDAARLFATARAVRGDLAARRFAAEEAHRHVDLTRADRYGTPTLGVVYEQDPAREQYLGAAISLPLPVVNDHRRNIAQGRATEARARETADQLEVSIRQAIDAGLVRLERAQAAAKMYRDVVLPQLATSRSGVERLFQIGDPSADILRVFDVRRKQLRAQDGYLDALFEIRQAMADLIAATGDTQLVPADAAVHESKGVH